MMPRVLVVRASFLRMCLAVIGDMWRCTQYLLALYRHVPTVQDTIGKPDICTIESKMGKITEPAVNSVDRINLRYRPIGFC